MQQEVSETTKKVQELENIKLVKNRIKVHIRWKVKSNAMMKELDHDPNTKK
jgi:hypothetical protein